jgi:hypothetical protein
MREEILLLRFWESVGLGWILNFQPMSRYFGILTYWLVVSEQGKRQLAKKKFFSQKTRIVKNTISLSAIFLFIFF